MCIIVDTNKLGIFFSRPTEPNVAPIHDWLRRGNGRLVYSDGGKFASEVGGRLRLRLREYSRSGIARLVPSEAFRDDERWLQRRTELVSDDPHVLALSRRSGVRLLYTGDRKLMRDFRNKQFIDEPRGKVYSRADNAGLLQRGLCPP